VRRGHRFAVCTARLPSFMMKGSLPQVLGSTASRNEGSWMRDWRLSL